MTLPQVSVIVTTKNEEKNIDNCLGSVQRQTYPQDLIEIIVVDNASTDRTKELARRYTESVFDKGPERSAQRNFGVRQAHGEYILYLDCDMILHNDVVKDCVDRIKENPDILGLYISEKVLGEGYFCRVRNFERSFYDATVIDCIRFLRKETFICLEGFDVTLSGPEDWDFDKRLRAKGRVDLTRTPIFHNESDFNLKKYITKKGYYAQTFEAYAQKWGHDDPDVRKQLGLGYRFFGVFWENGKWRRLISRPDLALGMYFLRFLVGLQYLRKS